MEEGKLQLIVSLLQQANKSLDKAIKLIEFLVGEKGDKNNDGIH